MRSACMVEAVDKRKNLNENTHGRDRGCADDRFSANRCGLLHERSPNTLP
ncbi:MAG: hypothetical protein EPO64_09710 [Nitrospirae bacterium]|nr:MAG: hypothetical protein EPO64_09710 [Nitrospirota bacterium]